jgi:outer membrane protein TolC
MSTHDLTPPIVFGRSAHQSVGRSSIPTAQNLMLKYMRHCRNNRSSLYQQTVLSVFQEVENALIASAQEQERHKSLAEAVTANQKAVELSRTLYAEGQIEFLNVLNAQRSLYLSEDALIQSTQTLSTNLISLYKALGGGWQEVDSTEDLAAKAISNL